MSTYLPGNQHGNRMSSHPKVRVFVVSVLFCRFNLLRSEYGQSAGAGCMVRYLASICRGFVRSIITSLLSVIRMQYTPEHCLVNGGFSLFWWKMPQQHVYFREPWLWTPKRAKRAEPNLHIARSTQNPSDGGPRLCSCPRA